MITTKAAPTLEMLRTRRDEILAIAARHGADNVRVFGSVARGEATPESDIDLLVRWDYDRMSSWGGVGLDFELQALFGRKVDVVSENGLSPYLEKRILKEAIFL